MMPAPTRMHPTDPTQSSPSQRSSVSSTPRSTMITASK
eukprot:CAMPEP_0202857674 /NCGR_PEP_ID=MMETSP1391-20130828/520_1 /ASSEMBLY_ACC=CAM_ASM_000867 /TAXON_ID=1034604 /ORGANISM="Chlamydomonas leiostraca, Strain SAG 11-49" /LENGTH=37 /DNA_ID= /DNA_START= /DNA_END= /DNA_ORIENTATION=